MFSEDIDHAELQLKDVDESVHAIAIMNAKAGAYFFHMGRQRRAAIQG
jgi:hypothetical protein